MFASDVASDRGKHCSVDTQRIVPPGGKRTVHERAKACDRQALRAREALPGFRFDKTPGRPGAGIQQDAHHGQVDAGAYALGGAASGERAIELCLAIDAARLEVSPAAMVRHVQIGIATARYRGNQRRGMVQTRTVDVEMARRAPATASVTLAQRARIVAADLSVAAGSFRRTRVTSRGPSLSPIAPRPESRRRCSTLPPPWHPSRRGHPRGSNRQAASRVRRPRSPTR